MPVWLGAVCLFSMIIAFIMCFLMLGVQMIIGDKKGWVSMEKAREYLGNMAVISVMITFLSGVILLIIDIFR